MIRDLLKNIHTRLDDYFKPDLDEMVTALCLHTASLEMAKHEYMELAACYPGQCGPFKLYGNSLPVFEYLMFEKRIMEFVKIRVEVSRKPARIDYMAHVESQNTADPVNHGKEVLVLDRYKAPFERLSHNLYRYFPYCANPYRENTNRLDAPKANECGAV